MNHAFLDAKDSNVAVIRKRSPAGPGPDGESAKNTQFPFRSIEPASLSKQ